MLDQGADVNARGKHGDYTPLHCACKNQSEFTNENFKLLLDHGASVNTRNAHGNTPLHRVLMKFSESSQAKVIKEVCWLLMGQGANMNAWNNENETPIVCCVKRGLSTFGASWSQTMEQDAEHVRKQSFGHNYKTVDMCKWLIRSGADINIRMCESSQTVYHYIVQFYLNTVVLGKHMNEKQLQVSCLVDDILTLFTNSQKGRVTINSRDEEGNTPLHAVSKAASWDKVQQLDSDQRQTHNTLTLSLLNCLISHGSKVNAVNDRQQTPLHLASIGPVIKTLLRSGAEPNVRNENGNTPLMM